MLTELHIEDLGVIGCLRLVLGPGLTALTGETGAGKTMLVEAIELLVGGRADPMIVRPGADEARVEGRFVRGAGDGEDEVVLTRVVPSSGRSRAYVNGRLATAQSLAEIAERLVDLHGQHAHQSLLSATTQRAALDRYASIDLEPLRAARARVTELDAALAALGGDERARAREIDLLRFQVDEITAAGLDDPDEDGALEQEEGLLADALAHREAGQRAVAALTDDGGARDAVAQAVTALGDRAPWAAHAQRLHDVLAEIDDVATDLRHAADLVEEDPERLAWVRARRESLRALCRKYGDDLDEVIAFHAEAMVRLDELQQFEQRAHELEAARAHAVAAVTTAARAVRDQRTAAAPRLAAQVEERLRTLALAHASVAVEVGEGADDDPGDRVQFLLAANPGSPLLPLGRVASGGELARAMLALRLVLSGAGSEDDDRTLVFDEVDAGVGGAAAVAVGHALAALGQHHQVLVVTHLPQVAALAGAHVVVTKDVDDGVTTATAAHVADHHRVDEVARMLAGDVTETARDHARELLERR